MNEILALKIAYFLKGVLYTSLVVWIRHLIKRAKSVESADPSSKIKSDMDEIGKRQDEIDKHLANIDEIRRTTTETLLKGIKEDR